MISVHIFKARLLVLIGTPDITASHTKEGILIGANQYIEHGEYEDGKQFAFTGDIWLVDEEAE